MSTKTIDKKWKFIYYLTYCALYKIYKNEFWGGQKLGM